ncbi:MAG: CheY-like chemotaxis protein [Lentimonas sp.]|jgi:CheY-like chemotaxis protein
MKTHSTSDPATEPLRVLLIDDEAAFTRMVKLNLEATGKYAVRVVNESPKAQQVANEFKPKIILLDVVMPEADGGDVAIQLRQHTITQDTPIIFVSAMVSRKESGSGFYESGGEHFLAKPVTAKLLSNAIDSVLGK